mgnify:CR=1 FL=1
MCSSDLTSFGDVAERVRARDAEIIVRLGRAIAAGDPDAAAEVAGQMLRADIERAA